MKISMKRALNILIVTLGLFSTSVSLADARGGGGSLVPGTSGLTLPSLSLSFTNKQSPNELVSVLRIVLMLTVLSLAPAILIMMTSFTRIVVVLSFLRQALG